jgi:hypothetical protein
MNRSITAKLNLVAALIVSILVLSPAVALSQDTAQDSAEKTTAAKKESEAVDALRIRQREQWTKYYIQKIKDYSFHFESDAEKPLKLLPDSKLHYLNTVRGRETHGEMFIWTSNGKCVLAGSILSYDMAANQRRVAHEFHSFSENKIQGGHRQFPVEMEAPGVKFEEIAGAPKVSKSRALRLVQLRRLAKSFEATTLAGGEVVRPLRALDQPIFRYETENIDDDGAVFAYVTGTDPELLVTIESRSTKDGPKWHFAAARFTDLPITLSYKKAPVWEFNEQSNYAGGYSCTHGIDFQPSMPAVFEEETEATQTQTTKKASK